MHDYQLQLVPQILRELRPDLRIGFYLHIPFPPAELFQQLPWRRQILEGLLGADLVGFQMPGAAANFVRLVRQRVGHKTHRDLIYLPDGRTVHAAAFPISIDAGGFEELAQSEPVGKRATAIREALGNPEKIFLGIDRLDYTKGIYARLRAYSELIRDGKLDVEEAVFVQVAVPSRERVEQYKILRDDIDRLVGRINGDIGRIGRPAISYLHTSYPREEMAALYRAADIMVVTPFRDGMNLVAKEYVACRFENDGALVLSEFAGAAAELRQAWLINPYDINGMKAALIEACRADDKELTRRMKAMRKTISQHDVKAWAESFMTELSGDRFVARQESAPGQEGLSIGGWRYFRGMDLRAPRLLPRADQVVSAASNVAHKMFYGGLADLRPMPRTLIDDGTLREVYHYRPAAKVQEQGDPVLLVTPLAAPAICFDLRRGCSLVEHFVGAGRPTYLVEYGEVSFRDRALGMEHWIDEVVPDGDPRGLRARRRPAGARGRLEPGRDLRAADRGRQPGPADRVGDRGRLAVRRQPGAAGRAAPAAAQLHRGARPDHPRLPGVRRGPEADGEVGVPAVVVPEARDQADRDRHPRRRRRTSWPRSRRSTGSPRT